MDENGVGPRAGALLGQPDPSTNPIPAPFPPPWVDGHFHSIESQGGKGPPGDSVPCIQEGDQQREGGQSPRRPEWAAAPPHTSGLLLPSSRTYWEMPPYLFVKLQLRDPLLNVIQATVLEQQETWQVNRKLTVN